MLVYWVTSERGKSQNPYKQLINLFTLYNQKLKQVKLYVLNIRILEVLHTSISILKFTL